MKRVRPKRRLAPVQGYVAYPHGQFRTLAVCDKMNRCQRRAQFLLINLTFRPPSLEPGMRFRHTIRDSFDAVAACECTPRANPV